MKNPARQIKKTISYRWHLQSENIDPETNKFLMNGFVIKNNCFELSAAQNIVDQYRLHASSFTRSDQNLSWPCLSKEVIELFLRSQYRETIDRYFRVMYGCMPVLQKVPSIVVTYPLLDQINALEPKEKFPAQWHTDYPQEFSVHIPLTVIDESVTHTVYVGGSARDLLIQPQQVVSDEYISQRYNKQRIHRMVAEPGDVIFLDVTGYHRANLRFGMRAMIQLKYTTGNDLLLFNSPINDSIKEKYLRNLAALKNYYSGYSALKKVLRDQLRSLRDIALPKGYELINRCQDEIEYFWI